MTPMTPMTPVTSMTLSRRRAVLSAAVLTGLPLLGPPAPARAEGTDINLKEWTLIDSLSDGFDAPLDSARWHRGLWYPTSGVGAFRDENAEVSDGVLRLWARAEGSGGGGRCQPHLRGCGIRLRHSRRVQLRGGSRQGPALSRPRALRRLAPVLHPQRRERPGRRPEPGDRRPGDLRLPRHDLGHAHLAGRQRRRPPILRRAHLPDGR